jgi:hypothetical protein
MKKDPTIKWFFVWESRDNTQRSSWFDLIYKFCPYDYIEIFTLIIILRPTKHNFLSKSFYEILECVPNFERFFKNTLSRCVNEISING